MLNFLSGKSSDESQVESIRDNASDCDSCGGGDDTGGTSAEVWVGGQRDEGVVTRGHTKFQKTKTIRESTPYQTYTLHTVSSTISNVSQINMTNMHPPCALERNSRKRTANGGPPSLFTSI